MKSKLLFKPLEAVAHLRANDEILGKVMDRVGSFSMEMLRTDSLFETMLRSIIYQQLHGNAAAAIHARMLTQLTRHGGVTPDAIMSIPDVAMRGAGLSANKLLAARDLALKCQQGVIPTSKEARRLSDDELLERLTTVRGIGTWTVHMMLIFHLGRPDVLPTGDFAIRQAFKKIYNKRKDPKPEAIIKHARRWRPYRSVASWYLWRFLDLP